MSQQLDAAAGVGAGGRPAGAAGEGGSGEGAGLPGWVKEAVTILQVRGGEQAPCGPGAGRGPGGLARDVIDTGMVASAPGNSAVVVGRLRVRE